MEFLVEIAADAVMWACADKWPRVIAFFIVVALIIGGIVVFGRAS